MTRERIKAEAPVRNDHGRPFGRASIPYEVRTALGAQEGDKLVFKEGNLATVERAALRGMYFIVRLEKGESKETPLPVEASGITQTGSQLEPFTAETVRKILEQK